MKTHRRGLTTALLHPFRGRGTKGVLAALGVTVACLAHPCTSLAVRPGKWTHTTEADFTEGKTEHVVVTNLGDVKLATATEQIAELPEEATIIYDLMKTGDGELYLASGPDGKVLRMADDKAVEVMSLQDEEIFCLDLFDDHLLVAAFFRISL